MKKLYLMIMGALAGISSRFAPSPPLFGGRPASSGTSTVPTYKKRQESPTRKLRSSMHTSRHKPHKGARECDRRVRQGCHHRNYPFKHPLLVADQTDV